METVFAKMPPYQRAIAKGHLGSSGTPYDKMNRPMIAVVNSWNEIVPGHAHLRDLAQDVKRGIVAAGGLPLEFNTIAICDGIAQGHSGMKYVLPSRELISDSIEVMIKAHGIFDGMVLIGSCDKIVPAMLMAAARLNIPAALVTGGPMKNCIKPYESKAARQKFLRGEIGEKELVDVTLQYYPTAGICPFLGTANTMCIVAEALGMSLPGSALIPALSPERRTAAYETGRVVMDLVAKQLLPRQIMTKAAFANATAVVLSMGASLNSVLHLPAIAAQCGVNWTYKDFDDLSRKTPLLTQVVPNSQEYTVTDLYPVGGIPAIMRQLTPVLHTETLSVNGRTLKENLASAAEPDGTLIHSFEQPISSEGGIAVLYGNLAPDGAVVKCSAVSADQWEYRGSARAFDSEEACIEAIEAGKVDEGSVIVIRYEGPIGGPGMREMHRATEVIAALGKAAIVTDGRFSGASGGLSIGYLSPEAAEGGPIALVEDGDMITINIRERKIHWEVSAAQIKERRKTYTAPRQAESSEFLTLYSKTATSAAQGAVRRPLK